MEKKLKIKQLRTDILIIGGGTAGCYAALTIREHSKAAVLIAEKANITRSGCLAAGVNAINAYIVKGRTPEDYVDYARNDADHIVREDLLLSMSQGLNRVTKKLEDFGLVILKDEQGEYVTRGNRNIKINGENIKPLLADAVHNLSHVTVLNRVNITDYIVIDNKIHGAYGFSIDEEVLYEIRSEKVICATGGAAGLYRPGNPGFSRHKMWYPPFNTGAGFAMGILAGAEMTTFEMRFIALRCKDTIAPTGTLAQGVGARQVNSLGEIYESKYGITTSERVYGTIKENLEGRGPCYLQTIGITPKQDVELKKAYLNMAPSQTLKWIEADKNPSEQNIEIEGTEPYIVGGHTASGYWVDTKRRTTIIGLYAAGDVAGGCPQKYVTGALVEGEIAALTVLADLDSEAKYCSDVLHDDKLNIFSNSTQHTNHKDTEKLSTETLGSTSAISDEVNLRTLNKQNELEFILNYKNPVFTIEQLEEAMQKVMDTYAGGISVHYQFNEKQLDIADDKINQLSILSKQIYAEDMHELMFAYELKERLILAKSVIAHLRARKETRWHCFAENLDYPDKKKDWLKYVNSRLVDGKLQMIYRELVGREDIYEHSYK